MRVGKVQGMRQVKRRTVVYAEVPEETLTDWAVAGDLEALTELHHREAAIAARFAAVVSGRPEEAPGMVAAAFRTTLTELSDGDGAARYLVPAEVAPFDPICGARRCR